VGEDTDPVMEVFFGDGRYGWFEGLNLVPSLGLGRSIRIGGGLRTPAGKTQQEKE
jgi:hypothetical protein